jgi:crotonobetainyl-CoA:carnitine CoA-transferase CaiB-like acyl-CoA transferase
VKNEDEWRGFCKSLGNPAWCQDPKFATFPLRKANERELNKLIEEWTRQLDAFYLMSLFQSHGVGAGVVLKPSQAHHDPQLGHRPARVTLDHAEIGPHSYATTGTNFSKMSPRFWRAAPLLGEDTQWVLREVLKLSEKEIGDLVAADALK